MPKPHSLPYLLDHANQLNIERLKKWGYFEPNKIVNASINWTINGNDCGSISIKINNNKSHPKITLSYYHKGELTEYDIRTTSIPSNLGKGSIRYFICPFTNKQCRKLYSIGRYFVHREANNNCMYDCQTQSKRNRILLKDLDSYFKADKCQKEIDKKYFKKYYAGKPTKRYSKLWKVVYEASLIPNEKVISAFLS